MATKYDLAQLLVMLDKAQKDLALVNQALQELNPQAQSPGATAPRPRIGPRMTAPYCKLSYVPKLPPGTGPDASRNPNK